MKITYKFADGSISEVEEELGQAITASRREEENIFKQLRLSTLVSENVR